MVRASRGRFYISSGKFNGVGPKPPGEVRTKPWTGKKGNKKKPERRDPLADNYDSMESFWKFWDTHSSADYEDEMETVGAEIAIDSRKTYCIYRVIYYHWCAIKRAGGDYPLKLQ